uniref:hypothetical protein n=1 Tax=Mycolicibacterium farcinogenes TaxID=1802 RepID=UPI00056C88B3|nr:hypothetical protein [Mycolicibacterium farcinogenes]
MPAALERLPVSVVFPVNRCVAFLMLSRIFCAGFAVAVGFLTAVLPAVAVAVAVLAGAGALASVESDAESSA